MSSPPTFPPAWSAVPIANYTMVGFDAGTLNIQYSSDCSAGPSTQQMLTVYPDKYTVLTRCDQGWNYVVDPKSRGNGCSIWPIQKDTCEYCSCPFCLRNTNRLWGSAGAGEVMWSSNVSSMSPVTGEAVTVWRGTQANGNSVEHAVSAATGLPVTQVVTSPDYLVIGTWFSSFASSVPPGTFDVPSICPAPPPSDAAASGSVEARAAPEPSADAVGEPASSDAEHAGAAATAAAVAAATVAGGSRILTVGGGSNSTAAPALPARFSAKLVSNISQPGYEGGNVLTVVRVDCSEGPARQRMHTTFGNFHSVLVDCAAGIVRNWDLAGIGCSTLPIGSHASWWNRMPALPPCSSHLPAWCDPRLRPLLRIPGRSVSIVQACDGLGGSPRAAPRMRVLAPPSTGRQASGVSARVCDACGLPFGFRDTGGVYRTGNGSGQTFAWDAATSDADGATTYHARLGGTLALAFTFARDGTPTAQRSAQLGWPRLLVETALCPV